MLGVRTWTVGNGKEVAKIAERENPGKIVVCVVPGPKAEALLAEADVAKILGDAPRVDLKAAEHYSDYLPAILAAVQEHGADRAIEEAIAPASAAIAVAPGFDDAVVATMQAALEASGRRVVIIGHELGWVRGQAGTAIEATMTFADATVADDAVIVAPGGVWPMKSAKARQAEQPAWLDDQDARDQARAAWLLSRHDAGATIYCFGFDSLRLAQDTRFKGKKFAGSPQTVWSFPKKTGGAFSKEPLVEVTERLIRPVARRPCRKFCSVCFSCRSNDGFSQARRVDDD